MRKSEKLWFCDVLMEYRNGISAENELSNNSPRGVFRTLVNIKMELFAKTVNGFQALTVSINSSILDV